MSIKIGKYKFEGPYSSDDSLDDSSGVYAILCNNSDSYKVIDVGESSEVRTRVKTHDRRNCWERNCFYTIMYAVYYTPHKKQSGRKKIEQEIREEYDPPCGDR